MINIEFLNGFKTTLSKTLEYRGSLGVLPILNLKIIKNIFSYFIFLLLAILKSVIKITNYQNKYWIILLVYTKYIMLKTTYSLTCFSKSISI